MIDDDDRPRTIPKPSFQHIESTNEASSPARAQGSSSDINESENDSPVSEYERETRMRQIKGLKKKSNDKSKRQSKNQRLKQINGELPENVTGMRTVVQVHCHRDLTTIPQPPTAEEREIVVAQAGHAGFVPDGFDTGPSISRQSKAYKSFVKSKLLKLGLERFSWDWDSSWTHPFNELMSIIFYKTLDSALLSCKYNNYTWVTEHNSHAIVSALMEKYFYHLQSAWRAQQKDGEALVKRREKIRGVVFRKRLAESRQKWGDTGGFTALAAQFRDLGVELNGAVILRKMKLPWRSEFFSELVKNIDHDITITSRIGKARKRIVSIPLQDAVNEEEDYRIPEKLSLQIFDSTWELSLESAVADEALKNLEAGNNDPILEAGKSDLLAESPGADGVLLKMTGWMGGSLMAANNYLILECDGADKALENLRAGKSDLLAESPDAHGVFLRMTGWAGDSLMAANDYPILEWAGVDKAPENLRAGKSDLLVKSPDAHGILLKMTGWAGGSLMAANDYPILEWAGADKAAENLRAGKPDLLAESLDAHGILLKMTGWAGGGLMAAIHYPILAWAGVDKAPENLRARNLMAANDYPILEAGKPDLLAESLDAHGILLNMTGWALEILKAEKSDVSL
ncbi:hypothetical protein PPACK8108_LOCUS13023 [Phakopsora pachyrhizi]|uniref:Uncharacterized protein n=1 Tax=Phakopsora pachyrhizi TaxID=170000 RepID=A0AAV0B2J4_PHAPC|nr:hypothetical protein PPACK8108_LOCUS13023 [Phakopsora pachyrhizi]